LRCAGSKAVAWFEFDGLPSENENGKKFVGFEVSGVGAAAAAPDGTAGALVAGTGATAPVFARGAGIGSGTSSAAAAAVTKNATQPMASRIDLAPQNAINRSRWPAGTAQKNR
jgi:hypothetical protein